MQLTLLTPRGDLCQSRVIQSKDLCVFSWGGVNFLVNFHKGKSKLSSCREHQTVTRFLFSFFSLMLFMEEHTEKQKRGRRRGKERGQGLRYWEHGWVMGLKERKACSLLVFFYIPLFTLSHSLTSASYFSPLYLFCFLLNSLSHFLPVTVFSPI